MAQDKDLNPIVAGDTIQDPAGNKGVILGIQNNGMTVAFTDDVTGKVRRCLARESTKVLTP